jgi:hypothetical protein
LTRSALAGLLMAAALASPERPKAAPSPSEAELARWIEPIHERLREEFDLPASLSIDLALRDQAQALAGAHLQRMRGLLKAWLAEERAAARPGADDGVIWAQLVARYVNELALWLLDSAGSAHDELMLRALLAAPVCQTIEQQGAMFALRVALWQTLPAAERSRAIDGERELLERWGKPRPALAPRPAVEPLDEVLVAVESIKAGAAKPGLPMPPVVAWNLLRDELKPEALYGPVRCAMQQWWLNVGVSQRGATAGQALTTFRYGTLPLAAWMLPPPPKEAAEPAPDAYPALARRWEVEGSVTVRMQLDAEGRVREARVAARRITVPGVRGERPVLFETLLDPPSLARTRGMKHSAPRPEDLSSGRATRNITFEWKLQ